MSKEGAILSQLRCIKAALCSTSGGATTGGSEEATQLVVLSTLESILENSTSKMGRISGAADYSRVLTYHGTALNNVITILHTGTTLVGLESITETINYVDPTVDGSNITSIVYT